MSVSPDSLRAAAGEMYRALLAAREFMADELAAYLDCACVIDPATLEPRRETLDPRDKWFVEGIEARLRIADQALARAKGASNDNEEGVFVGGSYMTRDEYNALLAADEYEPGDGA